MGKGFSIGRDGFLMKGKMDDDRWMDGRWVGVTKPTD